MNDNQAIGIWPPEQQFVPFPKIPRLKRGCVITEKIDGTNAQVVVGEDGSVLGFARWVAEHADGLREPRGYGLHERRFSLFNAGRWSSERPACCGVVPVLYAGDFSTDAVDETMRHLKATGSYAAPGFFSPEGIIVYMTAARHTYKVLAENDDVAKGEAA